MGLDDKIKYLKIQDDEKENFHNLKELEISTLMEEKANYTIKNNEKSYFGKISGVTCASNGLGIEVRLSNLDGNGPKFKGEIYLKGDGDEFGVYVSEIVKIE